MSARWCDVCGGGSHYRDGSTCPGPRSVTDPRPSAVLVSCSLCGKVYPPYSGPALRRMIAAHTRIVHGRTD